MFHNETNVNSVAISLGRCLRQSDPTRSWISWMFDDCILLPGALSRLVAALNGAKEPEIRRVLPLMELIDIVDGDNCPVA